MSTPPVPASGKFIILVIEDDRDVARLMAAQLEYNGFECHHARDGKSGIAAFQKIKPHLVLLDIMMPGMDGREVCAKIRASSTVPIIMITARTDSADQVQSFKNGADDYIPKPFEPKLLTARVIAHLRRAYRYDAPAPATDLQAVEAQDKDMQTLKEFADAAIGSNSAETLHSLFTAAREPYTLADIAAALGIPYKRVQHSRRVLELRPSTRTKVVPLDRGRPLHFSAAAADLIARHCRHPKRS
jgi:DNA-binding response OmpR family regulator